MDLLPALVPPASVVVALFAIYAVHQLSVRRQRRDERFKLCQAARDLVNEVAADAAGAWHVPGGDPEAQKTGLEVLGKLGRLARLLEALRGRNRRFEFGDRLIAFRRAVTADVRDVDRPPSPERADEVQATAADLDAAIDRAFRTLHG